MMAAREVAGTLEAEVSFYPFLRARVATESLTLATLLAGIKDGKWRFQVEECRNLRASGDTAGAAEAKRRLAAFTLSGTSRSRRGSESVEERGFSHNGWLQVDLDGKDHPDLSLEEMIFLLEGDPCIGFIARSPGGLGLKAGMRIPARQDLHRAAFATADARLRKLGLKMDPSTKDPMRLCYVTYDPALWIRPGATLELEVDEPSDDEGSAETDDREEGAFLPMDEVRVRDLLSFIPPSPPYDKWLRIASAVWNELGEEVGTRLLKAWSPEEFSGEYHEKYRFRLTKIAIGSVVRFAKEHGWSDGTRAEDVYYYAAKNHYFVRDGKIWREYKTRSHVLNRLLKRISGDQSPTAKRSIANAILQTVEERHVCYWAGEIAGFKPGPHKSGDEVLLITRGPNLIVPNPGSFDTVKNVIAAILGDDPETGDIQINGFMAWLKFSLEAVASGTRTPGHVLILVGPPECGKSLLVSICREILGGRAASPHQAWSKDTAFNADLVGSELLVLDDCYSQGKIEARRAVGTSMKESLFNEFVRIHPKGREAFSVAPVWRAIMCCNDDPDSLFVVPPLTSDMQDKMLILRCHKRTAPEHDFPPVDRKRFRERITRELPALVAHLASMALPPTLTPNPRTGFEAFHHPVIKGILGELSPEVQLLATIDYVFAERDSRHTNDPVFFQVPPKRRIWTAVELLSFLAEDHVVPFHLKKHLPSNANRLGRYLALLAKSHPGRVAEAAMKNGIQQWELTPPALQ
jgi:hypothetical protein